MAKTVLPTDVANYIVNELGRKLSEVIDHRMVNGEEPKYAVLMGKPTDMFVVVFVGKYEASGRLGDYEEATIHGATRTGWDCLYDSEQWEHTAARFKNAPYDHF